MGPGLALLTAGGISATAAIVRGGWPSPRIFIGSAIAGAALLGVAEVSPEVAGKFATLVLITAFLTSGVELSTAVTRSIGGTSK